jgi:uncharacterized membrane protein
MNKLLVVGLLIIIVGMALVFLGSASQGGVSTGGFILIGPFPIVFGTGANGGQLAFLALVVGLLILVLLSALLWRLAATARRLPGGNP